MTMLIFGGGSTEKEVSLASAQSVSNALNQLSYDHQIIDPSVNFNFDPNNHMPSFIFNMLHGGQEEGGKSQKWIENLGARSVSTRSQSAYILMNKAQTLLIAKRIGVKCPPFKIIDKSQYQQHTYFPHIIKTIFGSGSSLGTYKVLSAEKRDEYCDSWNDEDSRLVLNFINGYEYSCAVWDEKSFGGCMICYDAEFCSYDVKYNPRYGLYHTPEPDFLKNACTQAQSMAVAIYKALKCQGLIRFDFMIDYITHTPYFLEGNPNPGMTSLSIVPDIALFNHNLSYVQLIQRMILHA